MRDHLHTLILLATGCLYPAKLMAGRWPYCEVREGPVSPQALAESDAYWALRDGVQKVMDWRLR